MHANGLKIEHIFIGEWAVFFSAEEGEDAQEFLLVDAGVLHGVEDVIFAVAVDVEGRVEALLVFQEVTFADKAWFAGVEEPEEVVFVCHAHVFIFGFCEGFGDADGGGETDGVGVFGGFVEEDAGVAVRNHHFQAEEEFCLDLVEAGAGVEVVDHVVYHEEGVFFHKSSPFLNVGISGLGLCVCVLYLQIYRII